MHLLASDKTVVQSAEAMLWSAVVFGKVEEGMPLVRRMESCGSRSGKTMKPIIIADSGELPSRRQILAKIAAEREENANYKKDPLQVHHAHTPDCRADG